jgi:lactoylglutathione lyase
MLRMELFVENLQRAAAFYTEVLGFEMGKESEDYISVRRGNAIIGLGLVEKLADSHYLKPKADERKGVGVEIVLEVDGLEETYQNIVNLNYPIHTELANRPWGSTDFRIVDPDGYYIRITGRR